MRLQFCRIFYPVHNTDKTQVCQNYSLLFRVQEFDIGICSFLFYRELPLGYLSSASQL